MDFEQESDFYPFERVCQADMLSTDKIDGMIKLFVSA